VLGYVFWHRPHDPDGIAAYERALLAFHRSLARVPPVGFLGSVAVRVEQLPWRAAASTEPSEAQGDGGGYEDWYFVEDYAALGVLNEAAVGRGHRTTHDDVAQRSGLGVGGLYGLIEGHRPPPLDTTSLAVWVAGSPRPGRSALAELLGDGIDPRSASLWRRQLVLGPAPEFCLLAPKQPPGVAPARLPEGWIVTPLERETLWADS
jgi:hypothetical protein